MADFLIEIICEEIPARMQARAAADLERLVLARLADAGLAHGASRQFVAPRHLALYVEGLAERQEDVSEERRGPRADAPDQAIAGFLKSTGLSRDQLVEEDTPKGRFLFARIEKAGAATSDLLPDMITGVLAEFPWPKSQRWGATRFRWVRPLHRVNVLFGGAPLDGALDLGGASLAFTASSRGHYFEHAGDIDLTGVADADDYVARLRSGHVMVDRMERYDCIRDGAQETAHGAGVITTWHQGLYDEIVGLVEWPTLLLGEIEERFMSLPDEVLEASIRTHQKYITTQDVAGQLQKQFIVVSNRLSDSDRQSALNGGAEIPEEKVDQTILDGNQRVLRARLADAEFFVQDDCKTSLEERLPELGNVVFFDGLGSMLDKSVRIKSLAVEIAKRLPEASVEIAERGARLAKADLVTSTVGEFPELQGIMGGYYLDLEDASADVAMAVADHYRPLGPNDKIPATVEGKVIALADKIDSLVGFFGIGIKPTGSKDPLGLRRAALGVIRILHGLKIDFDLQKILQLAASNHGFEHVDNDLVKFISDRLKAYLQPGLYSSAPTAIRDPNNLAEVEQASFENQLSHSVTAYVLSESKAENIYGAISRAEVLFNFLCKEDGRMLLAGWRRVTSILDAEESKAKQAFSPETDPRLFSEDAERDLHAALTALPQPAAQAQDRATLLAAMQSLGGLRGPIDGFFDRVVVNDDDAAVRRNRLGLLAMVRAGMQRVADFSKLEG